MKIVPKNAVSNTLICVPVFIALLIGACSSGIDRMEAEEIEHAFESAEMKCAKMPKEEDGEIRFSGKDQIEKAISCVTAQKHVVNTLRDLERWIPWTEVIHPMVFYNLLVAESRLSDLLNDLIKVHKESDDCTEVTFTRTKVQDATDFVHVITKKGCGEPDQ